MSPRRGAAPAPRRRAAAPRPRLRLEVTDRGRPRTDRAMLRRVARAALDFAGRADLAVSLLLTDDREIGRLHAAWCGDPKPTDVISFGLDDTAELVVSVETARRQARAHGHAVRDEVALYVVHGLLHVCGFDDVRARDRVRMRAAERAVLGSLGIEVAPVDA